MNLVSWLAGVGFLILGIGFSIYLTNIRTLGLWIIFGGLLMAELAFAIQWQQGIWQAQSTIVPGFLFVTDLRMAFGLNIGTIQGGNQRIPTVTGQPRFMFNVQSVDRSAFDIRLLPGFLIADALPPTRPIPNTPAATPALMYLAGMSSPVGGDRLNLPVIPRDQSDMLSATCPFVISKKQEESIANKRDFFIAYAAIEYKDSDGQPHSTGFAGIWNVSTASFDMQANREYRYQR